MIGSGIAVGMHGGKGRGALTVTKIPGGIGHVHGVVDDVQVLSDANCRGIDAEIDDREGEYGDGLICGVVAAHVVHCKRNCIGAGIGVDMHRVALRRNIAIPKIPEIVIGDAVSC